jgi:hypothetical protein
MIISYFYYTTLKSIRMKTIRMKMAVLAACMFLWCGCSKTMDELPNSVSHIGTAVVNAEIQNLSSDEIGVAVANAFSYATNLDQIRAHELTQDKINVDAKDAESKMIDSMEDIYGANFALEYAQLKQEMTPELEAMKTDLAESLKQLATVDDADAPECVRKLIAGGTKRAFAKSMAKSSSAYQYYVNDFQSKLGVYAQSYLAKCSDQEVFVLDDLKSGMTSFIDTYQKTVNFAKLSKTEANSLLIAFSVMAKNMANTIDYTVYSFALAAATNPMAVIGIGSDMQKSKSKSYWKRVQRIITAVVVCVAVVAAISVATLTLGVGGGIMVGLVGCILADYCVCSAVFNCKITDPDIFGPGTGPDPGEGGGGVVGVG